MRRFGKESPYEQLKELTRGRRADAATMRAFIEGLDLPEEHKQRLLDLTPANYVGNSAETVAQLDSLMHESERRIRGITM
jgi:adenylosuccinate lyase